MKRKVFTALMAFVMIIGIGMFTPKANAASAVAPAGKVTTSSTALNVRSGATTTAAVVSSLPKNSYVRLLDKSGSFYKVEYASGKYGYASASYITEAASAKEATVNVSSGNLNVRTGASTANSVKTTLPKGAAVIVLSESNGWANILYSGTQTGYVSATYLKYQTAVGTPSYTAVSLSVPNFKQLDSRWSAVTLGTSGKTIGAIGCATTALAMTESYRLGYTITPADMSKRVSYSSGGSLYWPTNYVRHRRKLYAEDVRQSEEGYSDDLRIHKRIRRFALRCHNRFKGGSLTLSNFTITDPGSNTRVTLNQHTAAYPTSISWFTANKTKEEHAPLIFLYKRAQFTVPFVIY